LGPTQGDRLVNTMELVEEVATLRLDVRLAAALLEHDRAASVGSVRPISVTHQELADELGTVREMVSRLLDDFARQGMVVLGRGRIELVDQEKLHTLATAR
jgi:CRP/FNR family transcriptional regulator, anaerobic regulatory protein